VLGDPQEMDFRRESKTLASPFDKWRARIAAVLGRTPASTEYLIEITQLVRKRPVFGALSWITCGLLVGYGFGEAISAKDKGLVVLTLSVGCAGGLVGGLCGQIAVLGNGTTFSLYGLIFAVVGAAVALFGYRRLLGV